MASICRFMPRKKGGGLKTVNFVSECEFHSLRQPFFKTSFVVHLVTRGSAVLHLAGKDHELNCGSLFFAFPAYLYTVTASEDFEYTYITFLGESAGELLSSRGITADAPVYDGFSHLIPFWRDSITRITSQNANTLTESVLLYTLSFIDSPAQKALKHGVFEDIAEYIEAHFRDRDISLKKVAAVFNYTEKYLSSLFAKHISKGFASYIRSLRISYACELIVGGMTSVSQISSLCGYSDPLYFSKVFKAERGVSPREYIKKAGESPTE